MTLNADRHVIQIEDGQSNHVDQHQHISTPEGEYGVSDTKQSGKPITASIPELTPPISPTSVTTSPPNSCYSIDRRVDDAVVDELSLRKNDNAYKQPQIIVSPSYSTPSASTPLITKTAHNEQPSSSPATTKDAVVDDSKESKTEEQMIDIQEKSQEEQVSNKEDTALEKTIQEPVTQQEEKLAPKEKEALTTQEEKVQSTSAEHAQTQGQEPYVISSNDELSDKHALPDTLDISEHISTHLQEEQHQQPSEKEALMTEDGALTTQKEELCKDQKASITPSPEEKEPSPSTISVVEEETPIKEKEEEPITHHQVPENTKKEEHQSLPVIPEPSFTDPSTAAVKQDQEEHQPLLVAQESSSSKNDTTIIPKQHDQAFTTTEEKEDVSSPSKINNEHKEPSCSSTITHSKHDVLSKETDEKQDNDAMRKRVAYFDKKRTGRISMLDTFTCKLIKVAYI